MHLVAELRCQAYKDIGVEAAFIDSNTPKTERAEIVR